MTRNDHIPKLTGKSLITSSLLKMPDTKQQLLMNRKLLWLTNGFCNVMKEVMQ